MDNSNGSGIEGQLKDELMCSICLSEFEDPRYLPCLHTFCCNCIAALPKNNKKGGPRIKCPLCNKMHNIPSDGFPKNFMISNLQGIINQKNKSSSSPIFHCNECSDQIAAVAKCDACGEDSYMCEFHVEAHKKSKKTVSHPIVMLAKEAPAIDRTISSPTIIAGGTDANEKHIIHHHHHHHHSNRKRHLKKDIHHEDDDADKHFDNSDEEDEDEEEKEEESTEELSSSEEEKKKKKKKKRKKQQRKRKIKKMEQQNPSHNM